MKILTKETNLVKKDVKRERDIYEGERDYRERLRDTRVRERE